MGGTVHRFNVVTLFPDLVKGLLEDSIIKRALDSGITELMTLNPRDFSRDRHKKVDDAPFGGGQGMLLMCGPLFDALESIPDPGRVILLSPMGAVLNQKKVRQLAGFSVVTMICGHYEGIDHRVVEEFVDEEISLGDFILTGGEIAAAAVIDSVTRELDETLGNDLSKTEESFDETGLLEYEQYTRPAEYRARCVPEVLLSGNHAEIRKWKMKHRLLNTMRRRPDLIEEGDLSPEYREILNEIEEESHERRK